MKKILKRTLVIFTVFALVLAMAACGDENSDGKISEKTLKKDDSVKVTIEELELTFSDEIWYGDDTLMVQLTNNSEEYGIGSFEVLYRPKAETTLDDITAVYDKSSSFDYMSTDELMSFFLEDMPEGWTVRDNLCAKIEFWESTDAGETSDKEPIGSNIAGDLPFKELLDLMEPVTYHYEIYKNDGTRQDIWYDIASKSYISEEDAIVFDWGFYTWSDVE